MHSVMSCCIALVPMKMCWCQVRPLGWSHWTGCQLPISWVTPSASVFTSPNLPLRLPRVVPLRPPEVIPLQRGQPAQKTTPGLHHVAVASSVIIIIIVKIVVTLSRKCCRSTVQKVTNLQLTLYNKQPVEPCRVHIAQSWPVFKGRLE